MQVLYKPTRGVRFLQCSKCHLLNLYLFLLRLGHELNYFPFLPHVFYYIVYLFSIGLVFPLDPKETTGERMDTLGFHNFSFLFFIQMKIFFRGGGYGFILNFFIS